MNVTAVLAIRISLNQKWRVVNVDRSAPEPKKSRACVDEYRGLNVVFDDSCCASGMIHLMYVIVTILLGPNFTRSSSG